jgi:riboflavin kinase
MLFTLGGVAMNRRLIRSYLVDLVKLGAAEKMIRTPTTHLSIIFSVSQQSASRILSELADEDYIHKEFRDGNIWVVLTEKGMKEVEEYVKYIMDAFENPGKVVLEGTVESGMGEGAYYISKRRYQIQFKDTLGFYPYPGTLNVRLSDPYYISQNRLLRRLPGFKIRGFRTKDRIFGGAKVFKAVVEDKIEGGIVYAERSIYGFDVVEVISPHYLRGKLNLKDGDSIRVSVLLNVD